MLAALQKLSRVDRGRDEPEVPSPDEAQVYKALLLDLQFNQLAVSREYQVGQTPRPGGKLTRARARRCLRKRRRKLRGSKAWSASPCTFVLSQCPDAPGRLVAKPSPSPVKPLRDISQDELRIVLREWERKMKANILAKTEAIAEAQSQREVVDALKSQLVALREHVRAQDESIRRQGTLQSAMDQSRSDHAAAMERMVVEFNAVTKDTDALRARLTQSELEVAALRTKVGLAHLRERADATKSARRPRATRRR